MGYRLAGSLAIRADALERLSQAARRLASQGPFLPVEALRQLVQCEAAALPAVIAALGYRSAEEEGELRFHAPDRKAARQGRQASAPARSPAAATQPDSPFAALRDLKFTR